MRDAPVKRPAKRPTSKHLLWRNIWRKDALPPAHKYQGAVCLSRRPRGSLFILAFVVCCEIVFGSRGNVRCLTFGYGVGAMGRWGGRCGRLRPFTVTSEEFGV